MSDDMARQAIQDFKDRESARTAAWNALVQAAQAALRAVYAEAVGRRSGVTEAWFDVVIFYCGNKKCQTVEFFLSPNGKLVSYELRRRYGDLPDVEAEGITPQHITTSATRALMQKLDQVLPLR